MDESRIPRIDVTRGLYPPARQLVSPNQDARPVGSSIELIVVHGISLPPGQFGQGWVESLFLNRIPVNHTNPALRSVARLRVSAHLLIERDGNLIQFVSFKNRAWHAGVSSWQERSNCNDFSVGIELEGIDHHPYAGVQYVQLARLIRSLREAYPSLRSDGLVGHADIAPGRKTDPGPAFDWHRLAVLLAGE